MLREKLLNVCERSIDGHKDRWGVCGYLEKTGGAFALRRSLPLHVANDYEEGSLITPSQEQTD